MKAIAIVQARVGSKRLPAKVLRELNGRPSIYWVMERTKICGALNKVVLAIPGTPENDALASLAHDHGWPLFRGSEDDVVSRFGDVVAAEKPDIVVRVCADNFAIDPKVIEHGLTFLLSEGYDLCSPYIDCSYPYGVGPEVSTAETFLRIERQTVGLDSPYREHVYRYAYENPDKFKIGELKAPPELARPDIRVSVDTLDDFHVLEKLYRRFDGRETSFATADLIAVWEETRGTGAIGVQG